MLGIEVPIVTHEAIMVNGGAMPKSLLKPIKYNAPVTVEPPTDRWFTSGNLSTVIGEDRPSVPTLSYEEHKAMEAWAHDSATFVEDWAWLDYMADMTDLYNSLREYEVQEQVLAEAAAYNAAWPSLRASAKK